MRPCGACHRIDFVEVLVFQQRVGVLLDAFPIVSALGDVSIIPGKVALIAGVKIHMLGGVAHQKINLGHPALFDGDVGAAVIGLVGVNGFGFTAEFPVPEWEVERKRGQ